MLTAEDVVSLMPERLGVDRAAVAECANFLGLTVPIVIGWDWDMNGCAYLGQQSAVVFPEVGLPDAHLLRMGTPHVTQRRSCDADTSFSAATWHELTHAHQLEHQFDFDHDAMSEQYAAELRAVGIDIESGMPRIPESLWNGYRNTPMEAEAFENMRHAEKHMLCWADRNNRLWIPTLSEMLRSAGNIG